MPKNPKLFLYEKIVMNFKTKKTQKFVPKTSKNQ